MWCVRVSERGCGVLCVSERERVSGVCVSVRVECEWGVCVCVWCVCVVVCVCVRE